MFYEEYNPTVGDCYRKTFEKEGFKDYLLDIVDTAGNGFINFFFFYHFFLCTFFSRGDYERQLHQIG